MSDDASPLEGPRLPRRHSVLVEFTLEEEGAEPVLYAALDGLVSSGGPILRWQEA